MIALWQDCGLTKWWNDPDRDLDLFQETPGAEVFVGESSRLIVATVCVGHDGHRGWVYYLGVHPAKRSQGYGTAIMRHAEAWLVEQGIAKLQLLVRDTNLEVKSFYASLG